MKNNTITTRTETSVELSSLVVDITKALEIIKSAFDDTWATGTNGKKLKTDACDFYIENFCNDCRKKLSDGDVKNILRVLKRAKIYQKSKNDI